MVLKTYVTGVLHNFIGTEFAGGEVLFSTVQSRPLQVCYTIRRGQSTKRSCDL